MVKFPQYVLEVERLTELLNCRILDTGPENYFDDLVNLASRICDAPISIVSFVDADRQWFKAKVGLASSQTPRDISFCTHAILGKELFIVPDATQDPRFKDSPLVTGELGIRFYASAPIISANGHGLGAFCVLDRKPRELTDIQKDTLRVLARQISEHLENRKFFHECQEKLRVMERMIVLGEISGNIAHEINNPMAIISGKVDSMRELVGPNMPHNDLLHAHLDKIESTCDRVYKLVKGINLLSRSGETENVEDIQLAEVVELTRSFLEAKLRRHDVELLIDIDPELYIRGNVTQISQVILNLTNNGVQAVKEGEERWVKIEAKRSENMAMIIVTDSGAPLDMSVKKRIFEPFFTTKKAGVGTGLGLVISRRIIENHQGQIKLDEDSTRTRFVIHIPLKK